MKVLVTGGTGFTGGHLAKKLLGLNNDVRVLARSEVRAEEIKKAGAEIITGDIRDRDVVFKAVKGVQKVYHVAAAYREAYVDEKFYWDTNYKGSINVFDACLEYNVERLVHTSTIGVVTTVKNPPSDETEPQMCIRDRSCGLPVIASETSSIPEVLQHPDLLFKPFDEKEICLKMDEILSNDNLSAYIRKQCLTNSGKFSWSKTAAETLDVYRHCIINL